MSAGAQPAVEPLVLPLGDDAGLQRELVGGKAASVNWLSTSGFDSPSAICVSTLAYRDYLAEHGLEERRRELLARLPDDAARRELEALHDRPLPPRLARELAEAVRTLTADGPSALLAVRSSAVDEDSEAVSFAGQHATYLGVGATEVERAVGDCWASLWSAEAVSYRLARGIGFERAWMAVLVQPLVAAEQSAVVFTANPVTGDDDEVMVCAVRGLGEPLVSGATTPAIALLDKRSLAITETSPGGDEVVLSVLGGRLERVEGGAGELAVDEQSVRRLARMAVEVERLAGKPMDVEAACTRGRWQLLQARPVTARGGRGKI